MESEFKLNGKYLSFSEASKMANSGDLYQQIRGIATLAHFKELELLWSRIICYECNQNDPLSKIASIARITNKGILIALSLMPNLGHLPTTAIEFIEFLDKLLKLPPNDIHKTFVYEFHGYAVIRKLDNSDSIAKPNPNLYKLFYEHYENLINTRKLTLCNTDGSSIFAFPKTFRDPQNDEFVYYVPLRIFDIPASIELCAKIEILNSRLCSRTPYLEIGERRLVNQEIDRLKEELLRNDYLAAGKIDISDINDQVLPMLAKFNEIDNKLIFKENIYNERIPNTPDTPIEKIRKYNIRWFEITGQVHM